MPRQLLLVAGLLVATTAWADHPSFPDSPKAQQGLTQYDNLEFEAALTLFVEAAKDVNLAKEQRAMALIYGGLVAMTLGKNADAKTYFGQAVDLDPKVGFPADEASPKIAATLEEVRKAKTPDLSTPVVKPPDTLAEGAEKNEAPPSRLPIILGAGGAIVGLAAIVVVLAIVLKGSSCGPPSGTGCIDVHPSGAKP